VEDLPDVVPLLVYRDIERAHEFLARAFGLAPGLFERDESGSRRPIWCGCGPMLTFAVAPLTESSA
jgi:hypothetical protein